MEFSDKELGAILKVGHAMVEADGRIDPNEVEVLFEGLAEGSINRREELLRMADAMDSVEMISILSGMSEGHKRYVAGYLASIMISDNDIDEMEMRLWQLISNLCGFPQMTIREAVEFWSEN